MNLKCFQLRCLRLIYNKDIQTLWRDFLWAITLFLFSLNEYMANFGLRDISNGKSLSRRDVQTQSAILTAEALTPSIQVLLLSGRWPRGPILWLLHSYGCVFRLFFPLYLFMLEIFEPFSKNSKKRRKKKQRRILNLLKWGNWSTQREHHSTSTKLYIYTFCSYVCIHVHTYIHGGIRELLWGLNQITHMQWLAHSPILSELSVNVKSTICRRWIISTAFSTVLVYCQHSE